MKSYLLGVSVALLLAGCGGGSGSGGSDSNNSGSGGEQEIDGGGGNTELPESPILPAPGDPIEETPSPTNSSACFNEDLYIVGVTVVTEEEVYLDGTQLENYSETTEVIQITSYRGYTDVIEEKITSGEGNISSLYITADTVAKTITTLGQILDEDEITYHPSGLPLDYDINLGEKKTYPTVTEQTNGVVTNTGEYSYEFVRTESVTVPAGTFDTCVMELVFDGVSSDGFSSNTVVTQYVGVGNGMTIKEDFVTVTGDGETFTGSDVLVSATINGNPI
ncbi:hypothetical protein RN22_19320 [Grimontia sp. AD028]|uniref:hypothetical protein n=1 Tax=Grimontia sp. AD028 TaxID=1581149 RepID=UPI00061B5A72|nr:hypothetical protein [Grimontia sp. AD028]KKD58801.1 hypothetical protein RN22_19320 [Grimontia sp. AD028]